MNTALGNTDATVTYAASVEAMPVDRHASLAELTTAMDGGQVEVLVILGGNPVFTAPADLKFAERLSKVGLVTYLGRTSTRPRTSLTGTSLRRMRSRAGETRARSTERSR